MKRVKRPRSLINFPPFPECTLKEIQELEGVPERIITEPASRDGDLGVEMRIKFKDGKAFIMGYRVLKKDPA